MFFTTTADQTTTTVLLWALFLVSAWYSEYTVGWGDVPSDGPPGSKGQWPQFCSFPHALLQFAVGAAGAPAPCSEKESCL